MTLSGRQCMANKTELMAIEVTRSAGPKALGIFYTEDMGYFCDLGFS